MEFNNTTCITETEEINQLIDNANQYLLIVQGIIVSVIGMVGIVINVFVMTVILANKQLHTRPFMLCLQVIVVNIIFLLLLYIPKVLIYFVQAWLFGSTFCKIVAITTMFALVWRWLVMFLMMLDRLLTVVFPFSYKKHANTIMKILSVVVLLSFSLTLAPLVDIGCYDFTEYSLLCTISWQCQTIACLYYIAAVIVIFIVGAIAPVFMYIVMYVKARSFRESLMSQSASDNSQYVKSEQRARKTILLLFLCLICWALPSWTFYLVISAFDIEQNTTLLIIGRILSDAYYCIPVVDAVVILRNRDIKNAIRENMKDRDYNCCYRDITKNSLSVECTEVTLSTSTHTSV